MPNLQWLEIPFALESPVGSGASALPFNAFLPAVNPLTGLASQDGPQWILETEKCAIGAGKRVARDNAPQKPGEIIHKKYKSGLVMVVSALAADVVSGGEFVPACGEDLVDLFDLLMAHLDSIENTDGRMTWLPTGKVARMMLDARWLGADGQGGAGFTSVDVQAEDNNVFRSVQFALLSPFSYAMDAPETTTPLGGSSIVTIDNTGTTGFYPVIRVLGPASDFQILVTPALTGVTKELAYSASFPDADPIPGGQFIEFDFFRETAYFNGSGANAKPGIDVLNSDFWVLERGLNAVEIIGASANMLWQPAYGG